MPVTYIHANMPVSVEALIERLEHPPLVTSLEALGEIQPVAIALMITVGERDALVSALKSSLTPPEHQ